MVKERSTKPADGKELRQRDRFELGTKLIRAEIGLRGERRKLCVVAEIARLEVDHVIAGDPIGLGRSIDDPRADAAGLRIEQSFEGERLRRVRRRARSSAPLPPRTR